MTSVLRNLSIEKKLYGGFGAVIALAAVLGVAAVRDLGAVRADVHDLSGVLVSRFRTSA